MNEQDIENFKKNLPELPADIREKLAEHKINKKTVEDVLDNQAVYQKVLSATSENTSPENVRRIIFDSLEDPETLKIDIEDHIKISEMLTANLISSTAGKEILKLKAQSPAISIEELAKDKIQVSDKAELGKIVAEVVAENQKAAADVKKGEAKAIGFLVGQVMQKSAGKANPSLAEQIIKKQLNIE